MIGGVRENCQEIIENNPWKEAGLSRENNNERTGLGNHRDVVPFLYSF